MGSWVLRQQQGVLAKANQYRGVWGIWFPNFNFEGKSVRQSRTSKLSSPSRYSLSLWRKPNLSKLHPQVLEKRPWKRNAALHEISHKVHRRFLNQRAQDKRKRENKGLQLQHCGYIWLLQQWGQNDPEIFRPNQTGQILDPDGIELWEGPLQDFQISAAFRREQQ